MTSTLMCEDFVVFPSASVATIAISALSPLETLRALMVTDTSTSVSLGDISIDDGSVHLSASKADPQLNDTVPE